MKSIVLIALLGAAEAISINDPIWAPELHWNEDPHSVPAPLRWNSNEIADTMTSTQARFIAENSTANAYSSEPKGPNPWWFKAFTANVHDEEYSSTMQEKLQRYSLLMEQEDEDDLEIEDSVLTMVENGALWRVTPDYGELDANVVGRERDIDNGKKFSGWTNPLGWTDDGSDDHLVV